MQEKVEKDLLAAEKAANRQKQKEEREKKQKEIEERKAVRAMKKAASVEAAAAQPSKKTSSSQSLPSSSDNSILSAKSIELDSQAVSSSSVSASCTHAPAKKTKPAQRCSSCDVVLNGPQGKMRCTMCSTFIVCSDCGTKGFIFDHMQAEHPNARLPSRRNRN